MLFQVLSDQFYFSRLLHAFSVGKLPFFVFVSGPSGRLLFPGTLAALAKDVSHFQAQSPGRQSQPGRPFSCSIFQQTISSIQWFSPSNQAAFIAVGSQVSQLAMDQGTHTSWAATGLLQAPEKLLHAYGWVHPSIKSGDQDSVVCMYLVQMSQALQLQGISNGTGCQFVGHWVKPGGGDLLTLPDMSVQKCTAILSVC